MPPPENGNGGALYEELAKTPPKALRESVGEVEKLTPEDEEALDRGGKHRLRTHVRRVGVAFMWLGFGCAVVLATTVMALAAWLLWEFGREVVAKGTVGPILSAVVQFLFGVAATMAIEGLRKAK